ncbi:hypothetical protein C4D60_Mb08t11040 [Musa balbisiana]|uniref:Uncharacterized protein n=1 Tax=Musa balbisiana TaxID=52838 RepID=A0A4S8K2W0_MUSBA|nr:hypothetical protein C4D60_Mb08t11040 [Musa balbisiana]
MEEKKGKVHFLLEAAETNIPTPKHITQIPKSTAHLTPSISNATSSPSILFPPACFRTSSSDPSHSQPSSSSSSSPPSQHKPSHPSDSSGISSSLEQNLLLHRRFLLSSSKAAATSTLCPIDTPFSPTTHTSAAATAAAHWHSIPHTSPRRLNTPLTTFSSPTYASNRTPSPALTRSVLANTAASVSPLLNSSGEQIRWSGTIARAAARILDPFTSSELPSIRGR